MSATEERYGRATRSSHLKMKDAAPGDVDTLAAAGMSGAGKPVDTGVRGEVRKPAPDRMGAILMRLRAEYDGTRRQQLAARANTYGRALVETEKHRTDAEIVALLLPWAARNGPIRAFTSAEIKAVRRARVKKAEDLAAATMLSDHVMVLVELKTLLPAKQALFRYALELNERRGLDLPVDEILRLVGAALDAWLDRRCHLCDGRGFNGGYNGAPIIPCRGEGSCRETGSRKQGVFSEKLAGQTLAENLIAKMDATCVDSERKMKALLR